MTFAQPVSPPPRRRPDVCRVPTCGGDAFYGEGFCLHCGLDYVVWRIGRDERDVSALARFGYAPGEQLPIGTALAIDLTHLLFTPYPFG